MSDKHLHVVTFAETPRSKPMRVFEAASDLEALQFALSFHNACNFEHVIKVCRCEDTKLIPYCTLIK